MANAIPANTDTQRKEPVKRKSSLKKVGDAPIEVATEGERLADRTNLEPVFEDVTKDLRPADSQLESLPESEDEELAKHGAKLTGPNNEFITIGGNIFFADPAKRMEQALEMQSRRHENRAARPKEYINQDAPLGAFLPRSKSFRGVPYRAKSGGIKVNW
jgi:hypothetical protein